jgi:hypothetical protein
MKYLELANGAFTEEHYEKSLEENFPYVGYSVEENKVLFSEIIKDYVDLGLPSGTMWARCNVNAGDPYDVGDEFNMMYLPGISAVDIVPNGIEGEENGDMVYYFSDGKFRMPTAIDFNELLQYTYSILHFENENGESIEIRSNSEEEDDNKCWCHNASWDENTLSNYNLKYVKLISKRNGRYIILPTGYDSASNSNSTSLWCSTVEETGYVFLLNLNVYDTTSTINIACFGPGGNSINRPVRGIFVKRNKIDSSSYNKIDLGLRTDDGKIIYFADRNLGANSPEEVGNYYQWGTTEGVPVGTTNYPGLKFWIRYSHYGYIHSSSFWNRDATEWEMTKYNEDSELVLENKDDAAHIKLSGKWQIPDYNTLELLTNSDLFDYEYVNSNADTGEFDGVRVISKMPGFEGNSIYLPSTGFVDASSKYRSTVDDIKNIGLYWSKTMYYGDIDVIELGSDYMTLSSSDAINGLPIRPVCIENEVLEEYPTEYTDIDLGLPSGTLWVNKNLGGQQSDSEGLWFNYADVEGKTTQQILENGYPAVEAANKYGDSASLLMEDDPAYILLGENYLTAETYSHYNGDEVYVENDFLELFNNTDIYIRNNNGVYGPYFYEEYSIWDDYLNSTYGRVVADPEILNDDLVSIIFVKRNTAFNYGFRKNYIEIPFVGEWNNDIGDFSSPSNFNYVDEPLTNKGKVIILPSSYSYHGGVRNVIRMVNQDGSILIGSGKSGSYTYNRTYPFQIRAIKRSY